MPKYYEKAEKRPTVTQKEAAELAADAAADQEAVEKAQSSEALTDDELLDEIDSMIEENEVLINYRQKGGQ